MSATCFITACVLCAVHVQPACCVCVYAVYNLHASCMCECARACVSHSLLVYHIQCVLQSRCPVMQFYAFGCEKLGSMVATLATGSRMNNKKAHAATQPQNGLLTWLDHLTAPWKRWVMKSFYGNEPESIEKVRETTPDFANVHFPADHSLLDISKISARAFLVRSPLLLER